jgi:hypothetical protein
MADLSFKRKDSSASGIQIDKDGKLKSKCGYELIKEDKNHYRCSVGFCRWKVSVDEVLIDKFGNKYVKAEPTEKDDHCDR